MRIVSSLLHDDSELLLNVLPTPVADYITANDITHELVEVVLDVNEPAELRCVGNIVHVIDYDITEADIRMMLSQPTLTSFNRENRAGIQGTLHRVSVIRGRDEDVVGLTIRVGRVVRGTSTLIEPYLKQGKSILILGKPGQGKTTALRDACWFLSVESHKRVVIVDTANEIAGEGMKHPAVGRARRMMVPRNRSQAEVLIEAVENHMPEVVVVDEISSYEDAMSVRTISQRGVQILATVHGSKIEDLVENDPIMPILGRIRTSTVSDETMRKRGSKEVRTRAQAPAFDVIVEIEDWDTVRVYENAEVAIDDLLAGYPQTPAIRRRVNSMVVTAPGSRNRRASAEYEDFEPAPPSPRKKYR